MKRYVQVFAPLRPTCSVCPSRASRQQPLFSLLPSYLSISHTPNAREHTLLHTTYPHDRRWIPLLRAILTCQCHLPSLFPSSTLPFTPITGRSELCISHCQMRLEFMPRVSDTASPMRASDCLYFVRAPIANHGPPAALNFEQRRAPRKYPAPLRAWSRLSLPLFAPPSQLGLGDRC